MKRREEEELDQQLDRALDEIRSAEPEPAFAEAATERAWRMLRDEIDSADPAQAGAGIIDSCEDFQAMIPDYLARRLSRPRMLLLEDHLGECVPCRRAYKKGKSAATAIPAPATRDSRRGTWVSKMVWRAAAAAMFFLVLIGISFKSEVLSFEAGGLIRIESVDGELFRITDDGSVPLSPGDEITLKQGEGIRTAKDSSAILALADESQVEMSERSELAVLERRYLLPGRRADGVIDLGRGNIIVEASDQGSGHLYVDTDDCRVAVTGTVFAVRHGAKGSRVSVVEGEVHVRYAGNSDVLQPGQQSITADSLEKVPVEQDIAWSRNRETYLEILKEVHAVSREIDEAMRPGLRYTTDLLNLVPADTALYVAIPNVSDELGEAYAILRDRMSANPILNEWWEQTGEDREQLEEILDKIQVYGDQLGEEVVLAQDVNGKDPLFLARLVSPESFKAMIETQIAELDAAGNTEIRIRMIEGPIPVDSGNGDLLFRIHDDLVAFTTGVERLHSVEAVVLGFEGASLVGSDFHGRLDDVYRDGVEWLVGVDLQRLIQADGESTHLDALGFETVQHLIAERKQQDDMTLNSAVLTFAQPRERLAGWLAEPAPIGALDYIGPGASFATGFVMKDAGVLVDELFDVISTTDSSFDVELAGFEQEHRINIRRDVAAPLGGEFALALDGPVLPMPSWKLVLEVYDRARLQQTLEWAVGKLNEHAAEMDRLGFKLEPEVVGSRKYFRLESLDTTVAVHYTFDNGYLIAGPSRALLDRAIQTRASGVTLKGAPEFVGLMPRDGQVHFSGVLYHNLGPITAPLAQLIDSSVKNVDDQSLPLLQALSSEARPGLALFYGENDRITFSSVSEGGLLTSGLNSLTGMSGLIGVQQSLVRAAGIRPGGHN